MITRHRMFALLLALLAGLVVLVAACTGGDDDDVEPDDGGGFVPNEDTIYDADDIRSLCNLLTRDEVEAILQTGISKTVAVKKPDGVACIWFIDYTGENLEHGGPVQVRFITEGGRAEFEAKRVDDTTNLEGFGEAAYTTADGRSLHVLTSEETAYFLLDGSFMRTWTRPDDWQEKFAAAVFERVCPQEAVPLRQPC